ncbi:hypothetical protein TRFO_40507 [Tritrichomonas foetus]|uniref:Importin N-terminal domain-containing protein n=1 Tax=Tritrichomonas foetus TaxID=1144522 RepID=A0A1J4J6Z0_9EUKA|nr:hypothetical protein TRFO_40507 [Tritrichomonas foetus]|eukprot:OHS93205.1 hypothetical protein TRFO_40507 [Tritrichomonas foetus]
MINWSQEKNWRDFIHSHKMADSLQEINNLLNAFCSPDNEFRRSAEVHFFELLDKDPNTMINLLFMSIKQNQNTTLRMQALIRCRNFLMFIMTTIKDNRNILSPETYGNIIECLTFFLQNISAYQPTEVNYFFLIINILIPIVIIPGNWPAIFEIMWTFLETPHCSKVINFFAHYISSFNIETIGMIPPEIIGRLPHIILFNAPDPAVRVASVSLGLKLTMFDKNMYSLFDAIPTVISTLPEKEMDEAITSFLSFFQSNYSLLNPYLDKFTGTFIQIAANKNCGSGCISSLEAITTMLSRSPQVHRFISENLLPFIQALAVCFAVEDIDDDLNDDSLILYNTACLVLQEFVDQAPAAKKPILSIVESAGFPPIVISTFYKYIPHVTNIGKIIELAQIPVRLISQNAFDTIDDLLNHHYQKLVSKNPGIVQNLAILLFGIISSGRVEAIEPLARLAESLAEYNKKALRELSGNLIDLTNKLPNTNTIRCVAALATSFPEEISANAKSYATAAMNVIMNGVNEDDCYALMVAISKFTKCMPTADLQTFVVQLMSLVSSKPETSMFLGLRLIAKQIGQQFSGFLPSIIPYLLNAATQKIDMIVEKEDVSTQADDSQYSVTYIPGGTKLVFRNEQFAEITSALESLGDYAVATGNLFAPYFEASINAAQESLKNVFDSQIRIAGVNLYLSLITCNPSSIPVIFTEIIQKVLNDDEPEVCVQQELMNALDKIVRDNNCPAEIRSGYLQNLPKMVEFSITSIRKAVECDEFEGVEDDNYLNMLWSFALALKFLYTAMPEQSGPAFLQLSQLLNPFQNEPILLINQFSLAVWTDFLIFGPPAYVAQCDAMIPQVVQMSNAADKDMRRMALYAIGRIFEKKNLPAKNIDEILFNLYSAVMKEEAQEDESLFEGNDNALSSYAILLRKRIPMRNSTNVIAMFVKMFPAEDDLDEAKIAYELLFDLFVQASTNPEIAPLVQEIAGTIIEGLEIEVLSEIIQASIQEKLQAMGGNIPQHVQDLLAQLH